MTIILLSMTIISLTLVGIGAVVWVLIKRDERKHVRQGYWVEYVSPGRLRADEDDFAVVYHELERWQFFCGKTNGQGKSDQLSFPDDAAWQEQSPGWLSGKREIVLERVERGIKHIEIVIVPEFPSP